MTRSLFGQEHSWTIYAIVEGAPSQWLPSQAVRCTDRRWVLKCGSGVESTVWRSHVDGQSDILKIQSNQMWPVCVKHKIARNTTQWQLYMNRTTTTASVKELKILCGFSLLVIIIALWSNDQSFLKIVFVLHLIMRSFLKWWAAGSVHRRAAMHEEKFWLGDQRSMNKDRYKQNYFCVDLKRFE